MANGLNIVILAGNLGADPELRHTQNGSAVLSLRVATSERIKRGEEWVEEVQWHSVSLWGNRATALAPLLTKGTGVTIYGGLRYSSYEAPDGTTKYRTDINAREIVIGKRAGGNGAHQQAWTPDDAFPGDDIPPEPQKPAAKPATKAPIVRPTPPAAKKYLAPQKRR